MSDHELRELERRAQESEDPADEAALLQAQARAGKLPSYTRGAGELLFTDDHDAAIERFTSESIDAILERVRRTLIHLLGLCRSLSLKQLIGQNPYFLSWFSPGYSS